MLNSDKTIVERVADAIDHVCGDDFYVTNETVTKHTTSIIVNLNGELFELSFKDRGG